MITLWQSDSDEEDNAKGKEVETLSLMLGEKRHIAKRSTITSNYKLFLSTLQVLVVSI